MVHPVLCRAGKEIPRESRPGAAHADETSVYEYEARQREFSVLTKAGYRCDEIILANSLAVWADRLPDRLSSKSITAEKIATACGRMLLNAPKDLSEEFYEYLAGCFGSITALRSSTKDFGDSWEAVQYGLNPQATKTLVMDESNDTEGFSVPI